MYKKKQLFVAFFGSWLFFLKRNDIRGGRAEAEADILLKESAPLISP